jgi:hypothetical protein
MTIDQAIAQLQHAKDDGIRTVFLAWWDADFFDCTEDGDWDQVVDHLESEFDWSIVNNELERSIDNIIRTYGFTI